MTTLTEPVRTGLSVAALEQSVLDNLAFLLGRYPAIATPHDWYMALAWSVRDRLVARWIAGAQVCACADVRVACYFSAEFLIGPQLGINLLNLGIQDAARAALAVLGQDLDALLELEEEPGLGNGGLGRLAACYMDSLATLEMPAIGYGIRYEFGIFDQEIRDGWQVEVTDKWLAQGSPWEMTHGEDITCIVNFGGHTEQAVDAEGRLRVRWVPGSRVRGVACDIPILGYRVNTCNTLRLWKSEAVESFDFEEFNVGDYVGAVRQKIESETLSKVLYPNDDSSSGKRLRLAQQYFFVSCSLQDMLRLLALKGEPVERLPRLFAAQLNDTHPSIAVAELMRLLVDERELAWEAAWDVTRQTLSYTNHTLLPEALETWGVELFGTLLPRHLEIVYEINRRFLDEVRRRFPADEARVVRMSLVSEGADRRIRMAHLATVGTHHVNGVAELHTELLRTTVLRDFAELWPERFASVTNGVTPRRFVKLANPEHSALLDEIAGPDWVTDPDGLRRLEAVAQDPAFQQRWRLARRRNKEVLAKRILDCTGIVVDPAMVFDVQVKRIHEYKRAHLNALHVIALWRRLREDPAADIVPRCFVFGGKAAPGYAMAKLIIRLINGVAEVVNGDPKVAGRLKVVFFPDFNVRQAEHIYPAAEVSEQISTAGREASGTGNMKFMMNGALTIGTLDGANVEIREAAGAENFFLFGLTAGEVAARRQAGYRPRDHVESDPELKAVLDLVAGGTFSRGDASMFAPLVGQLLERDDFLLLADYRAYAEAQARVDQACRDTARWTRMSILNTARSGRFSSDRAVREYGERIWRVGPVPVSTAL